MNAVSSQAFTNAGLILALNIAQKLITFTLNQILVISTNPELLGLANIQYDLLLTTLLFLSRESIRLVCLRESIGSPVERQQLINISWLPAILILLASTIILWYSGCNRGIVLLYCVGAFIESAGEPWNNSNLVNMTIRPRIIGEFIGLFVKSVLTYLFLVYYNYGIYSFGIGQVGYSIALLATIIVSTSGSLLDYFPRYVVGFSFFNLKTAQLAMSNTAVVLLKHVLTEADKITLSMLATAEDQGVYAITSNYGSLIARLIFLPIEDSTKLAVAKLAAIIRAESKNGDEEMAAIAVLITTLLRMSLLIFILLPVVGPHYVELLVTLVFTSNSKLNHSTFIATLSAYCVYLYTLALNGVSEAYVHAIAPAHVLGGRINYGLLLSSVAYFIVVISIKGATTCVIIYAGAGAMAVRALSNITYIRQTLHIDTCHAALDLPTSTITRIPQATILPFNFVITLLLLGVFVLTYLSADYYHVNHTQSLKYAVQHLLLGVVCVLSYLYCTYRYHRTDYLYIYDLLVRRKAKRD